MLAPSRLFAFRIAFAVCWIAFLVPLLSPVALACESQENAIEVRSAEDVIAKWRPDQHLYIKGDLGISKSQLSKLEKWLDDNGSHWTIVLMQQAEDEAYHSLDQRSFYGMDAVEYALGHGLANRTDFGGLIHPQTGETDGAVFVLFLVERKFSYYGSDLQDRRGLGESKWIGDLDRPAIRAMRNGGRIVDAVKNTVTSIDRRVAKQIRSEEREKQQAKEATERARLERLRELDYIAQRLEETSEQMFPRIEESARQIRSAFPAAADSKLANPPLEPWKQRLVDLKKDLANIKVDGKDPYQQSPSFRELKKNSEQLRGEIDYYLDLYAAHKSFGEILSPVEQRLDLVADDPSGAAIESSDEAFRILEEARQGYARGEVEFVERVQQVEDLIDQGEQAIKLEKQRVVAEAERKKTVRRTLYIVATLLGAGLLGLLWFLNLRRRPALRRAHDAFDVGSKAVDAEFHRVEPVIKRAGEVIGSKTSFAQKGFKGQTQELGMQTLANVQLLEDMGKEARGVIEAAYTMLHPSNPISEAANMISAARYEHCTRLLTGPSLRTIKDGSLTTDSNEQDESSGITFGEFFTQLRGVNEQTESQLDILDESLTEVVPTIERLQAQLDDAVKIEKELAEAAKLDKYFRVPAFFEKLIPSAQQDCERANSLSGEDPVRAMRQYLPLAQQKIVDGLAIANTVQKSRSEVFPQLDKASEQLKDRGFDIRWIEQSVLRQGERADQLMGEAAEQDLDKEIREFDGEVTRLGLRARRTVELATEISEVVEPALDQLQQEINTARRDIANELNLDESKVLNEADYDPDVELRQAREQHQSARAALDYGGVESALESMEILEIEKTTASQLVASSLAAVKEFAGEHQSLVNRESELANITPEVQSTIDLYRSKYAESALIFRTQDELEIGDSLSDSSATIVSCMAKSVEFIDHAAEAAGQAQELHSAGRVLQAANVVALTQDELELAARMFEQIKAHCRWLDDQTRENSIEMGRRLGNVNTLNTSVDDPRTQPESQQLFNDLRTSAERLNSSLQQQAQNRDPFQDHQRLQKLANQTESLEAMIASDWREHTAATRAVEAAQSELVTAQQSVTRSIGDQIPDSQTIKKCQSEISRLASELDEVANRINISHGVWRTVSEQADRILAELGVVDGHLRRELELAQDAVRELRSASTQVFEAASWKGSYGIKIISEPGAEELSQARRSLAEGEYLAAIDFSRSAEYHAKRAIDMARSRVRKKKQEIAREAAAARRRRNSAFSGFTSGSSFGKSFSSSSRSSSFGSSSRSSWSSSSSRSSGGGSGFRRSGW